MDMAGDFQRQKIDVIYQHTKEGRIIPMRIRMDDEDGMIQTYNIRSYNDIFDKIVYHLQANGTC